MSHLEEQAIYTPETGLLHLQHDTVLCQSDYPKDWYQNEFMPYAEAYQALPDRRLDTVLRWMKPYMKRAQNHFGSDLLLLAHYYMGGEIVKLIEAFGGQVGDSYQLARMVSAHPEKKLIVESAVHFMAETISILASPEQTIYITNPKAGCTMEMLAKDFMVQPALDDLNERYGRDNVLPICYMNTSARVKAMTGAQGGAVCTSSNVEKIVRWAHAQNKKIIFIPDKYMGENVADRLGIVDDDIAYWPGGSEGATYQLAAQNPKILKRFDRAQLILFSSYCAVHSYYQAEMVQYWKSQGYHVVVHPECRRSVVSEADSYGSTAYIWDCVTRDRAGTRQYAIATENHMVSNLKQYCQALNIKVVNVAEAPLDGKPQVGCGCATMSRNDPPHLIALLDLLRQGKTLPYNQVQAGDLVNEFTGQRTRLSDEKQAWVRKHAKRALDKMIELTEA